MNWLLTVTGPDAPGIAAALTCVLSQFKAKLLDIEQVVVHGQLTLCLSVLLQNPETVLKELLFEAKRLGQDLRYQPVEVLAAQNMKRRYALSIMADPITAQVMHSVSTLLAAYDANIESIRRLSQSDLSSLEIALSIAEDSAPGLKKALLEELSENFVDIALQRESLTRRNKRLVVLDMDSTLIQQEVIDELARVKGVYTEVSQITRATMEEGLDFSTSLKRRVALLKGLEVETLQSLVQTLTLSPGAEQLIRVLKSLGYQIGIISGGFEQAAKALQERLNLDFAYANRLLESQGRLTGEVALPIVNAERKAELLEHIAREKGIPLEQTIAIGDGANDALMLARAGLGIAYYAKPILKQSADTTISAGGLERILYLLGIPGREVAKELT